MNRANELRKLAERMAASDGKRIAVTPASAAAAFDQVVKERERYTVTLRQGVRVLAKHEPDTKA